MGTSLGCTLDTEEEEGAGEGGGLSPGLSASNSVASPLSSITTCQSRSAVASEPRLGVFTARFG